ncbi:MAG: hypothetical protein PHC68_13335 [Syntrophorhabdaceae bacterium]|nr:hypothetical protein [Syntrophorhabdaceae bacterium]
MNHQARPPRSPPLSEREKRLIKILHEDGAFAIISYADVARILNMVYRSDNQGCRTRDGVYSFLKGVKSTINI